MILPWAIWSVIFAIAGAVYWKQGQPMGSATGRAAAVATLLTFGALMAIAFGLQLLQRG